QASDDEIATRATQLHLLISKREWFPNFRPLVKLTAVPEIKKLKWKIEARRHHADNGETLAVKKKLLPDDLLIAIEPTLPQSRADDNDIVATERAFLRFKESPLDR